MTDRSRGRGTRPDRGGRGGRGNRGGPRNRTDKAVPFRKDDVVRLMPQRDVLPTPPATPGLGGQPGLYARPPPMQFATHAKARVDHKYLDYASTLARWMRERVWSRAERDVPALQPSKDYTIAMPLGHTMSHRPVTASTTVLQGHLHDINSDYGSISAIRVWLHTTRVRVTDASGCHRVEFYCALLKTADLLHGMRSSVSFLREITVPILGTASFPISSSARKLTCSSQILERTSTYG